MEGLNFEQTVQVHVHTESSHVTYMCLMQRRDNLGKHGLSMSYSPSEFVSTSLPCTMYIRAVLESILIIGS